MKNHNSESFNGFLTAQDTVIAHHVRLDRTRVVGAVLDGSWIGRSEASVKFVRRSPDEIKLQLQVRSDYLKCVQITLRQAEDDVVARVDWAAYTSADHNCGYVFSDNRDPCVPIATSPDGEGYGVSELHFNVRSSRPILVDGSNIVRHFPRLRSKALAYTLECLKNEGYDPRVFFDANIRYVLKEGKDAFGLELLERLLREDKDGSHVIIVPAGTVSDDHMLLLSDTCGYPIVSCDTFSQERYRQLYPWLRNRVESNKKRVHAPAFFDDMLLITTLGISWRFTVRGEVHIRACCNGRYFCADDAGLQNVRPVLANRDCPSDWERFTIIGNGDGTVSIKSNANGKYLSAEVDSDGRLNARSDVADAWEKFMLKRRGQRGHCTLQSCANKKYVSVVPSSGHVLAMADVANEWEWLTIVPCD